MEDKLILQVVSSHIAVSDLVLMLIGSNFSEFYINFYSESMKEF